MKQPRRNVCFVTGTRADFGLMRTTLAAIERHPSLNLQIVACGMHTVRSRGKTVDAIARKIDAVIPWTGDTSPRAAARATGRTIAKLADAFHSLNTEIVLVVGDRVEAFAAATAGHLSGKVVAHVHGGDRAMGQADDSLRHAITKLSHLHFAATSTSAQRIRMLGEDAWRVIKVGAPGIDGIAATATPAALVKRPFALLVLHPVEANDAREEGRARATLQAILSRHIPHVAIVHPNNDPGSDGIAAAWRAVKDPRVSTFQNLSRPDFLGLLRDAAMLVGNSSAGIIEAASFGTPVIDIGPRQSGRECGANVLRVSAAPAAVRQAVGRLWRDGNPVRFPRRNPYGGNGAGKKIAEALAGINVDSRLLRKLIAY